MDLIVVRRFCAPARRYRPSSRRFEHRVIEQQMVIAEMRATHVPVEILRLDIESEHVREQFAQLVGDLHDGIAAQVVEFPTFSSFP